MKFGQRNLEEHIIYIIVQLKDGLIKETNYLIVLLKFNFKFISYRSC